jgi:hypothetical protein
MRKTQTLLFFAMVFAAWVALGAVAQDSARSTGIGAAALAATPPMGWNSWDGYGTTVNEADAKANANWLAAHLKDYGWQYVVVDMEWFVTNPTPEGNSKNSQYELDEYGRYVPAPNRFPSAAASAGFKPLADYVHSLGLKFGIHILRGIPKQAVEKNLPVQGTQFRAADAALQSDTCPWNFDNFGIDPSKPAGQAYYDSIARGYAQWDVDLIKVDCIASHPYKGEEIRMLSEALRKTGRPIVLSLSPGAAPLDKADEMGRYAQMWRISDDIWDLWHSTVAYPQGLGDQFPNAQKWAGIGRPGAWPDADMLPLGFLGPAPGWGKPRQTRLTHDEQRTLMTLWCIFPSSLMVGGDLTKADSWTTSLLTNREVLDVDQHSTGNRVAVSNEEITIWVAQSKENPKQYYVAAFNRSESSRSREFAWKDLGLGSASYRLRDLWEHKDLGQAAKLAVSLPSHASLLYAVQMDAGHKP